MTAEGHFFLSEVGAKSRQLQGRAEHSLCLEGGGLGGNPSSVRYLLDHPWKSHLSESPSPPLSMETGSSFHSLHDHLLNTCSLCAWHWAGPGPTTKNKTDTPSKLTFSGSNVQQNLLGYWKYSISWLSNKKATGYTRLLSTRNVTHVTEG